MNKIITTYFVNDDGAPVTGLSVKIRIRDILTNALVVTDASMTEIGDGGYKYNYTDYDQSRAYQIRCYAGSVSNLGSKYSFGFNKSSYYVGLSVVTAYFLNDEGEPATGLVPTVRIRDLSDNSIVVNDAAMTEVGDGGYKYYFSSFSPIKNYQVRCDAGSSIEFRYSYGFNGEYQIEVMDIPLSGDIIDELSLDGEMVNEVDLSGTIEVE